MSTSLPDVLDLLPHRYPILLVDRVTALDPGRRAEIRLSVELIRFRRGLCRTRGEARVEGKRIVRAELTTVLRAAPAV